MIARVELYGWRVFGVILFLAIWELNSRVELFRLWAPSLPGSFFPALPEIARSALVSLTRWEYWNAVALTVGRTSTAFGGALFLGVILALLTTLSARLYALFNYPFEFCRQLPAVAIVPFAVLLFGVDSEMKIAVAFFGCFFPIYVGAAQALRNVDPLLLLTANLYQWRGARLLVGVMLPAIYSTLSGLARITLAIALILVIMAEMLVGGDGLGARLSMFELSFRLDLLYAETFLLGCLGVILNSTLAWLVRVGHFWRESEKLS